MDGKMVMDTDTKPTTGTALQRLSTGALDLTNLPERLDDQTLAELATIADCPLPEPLPCSDEHFSRVLRMMLAVLPRRRADELDGELFVTAYERGLRDHPRDAIDFMCDEAIRRCKWFPTVAECVEIISEWVRNDAAARRREAAARAASHERYLRWSESRPAPVEETAWTPNLAEIEAIKREVAQSFKAS